VLIGLLLLFLGWLFAFFVSGPRQFCVHDGPNRRPEHDLNALFKRLAGQRTGDWRLEICVQQVSDMGHLLFGWLAAYCARGPINGPRLQ